jgi:hypothetical protein
MQKERSAISEQSRCIIHTIGLGFAFRGSSLTLSTDFGETCHVALCLVGLARFV